MLANLVCSLIEQRRVKTTLAKAKAARSLADRMVTLGKTGTLAARRQAAAVLRQKDKVRVLFDEIAPALKDRSGGYTRIVRLGPRRGDSAEMAILEWTDYQIPQPGKGKKKREAKKPVAEKPAATEEAASGDKDKASAAESAGERGGGEKEGPFWRRFIKKRGE